MEPVHVSTSSKALLNKVRRIVPPLLERFHKGLSHGLVMIGNGD